MKVLATGATGQYANHVVAALVAQGIDVRGVAHDPGKADAARRAGATETVQVDLADADGIAEALHGVEGVFLITPAFHPDATSMALDVVAAAVDAGVEKLVYNGVYHPSLSLPNHAGTRPVEEALYESDLDFTVLQPAMYVQALEATYRDALATGAVVAPWSKHSKMTYVDYRDVAEVAALAFVESRLSRGTFELAAGGMVDRVEIAEMMSRVAGRALRAAGYRRRAPRTRRLSHDVRRLRPAWISRGKFACPAIHSAPRTALGRRLHRRARAVRP